MAGSPRPNDPYGSDGGVPDQVQVDGSGAQAMRLEATPQDFGANVGGAVQDLGSKAIGGQVHDALAVRAGMMNEAAATDAESQLIQKNSTLKGQFMTTEGKETQDALPAYRAAILDDSDIRGTLSGGALRMYDTLATRQKATYLADAEGYGAAQVKKYSMDSAGQNINAWQALANSPTVANDPSQIGEIIGNVKHNTPLALGIDENTPGIKKDPNTGNVGFDTSTPQGQALKDGHQAAVDNNVGVVHQNVINTLASTNPIAASDYYSKVKNQIPPAMQVHIEASLAPQVINAYAQGAVGNTMQQANQAHQQFLLNPNKSVPIPPNPEHPMGNLNTPIPGLGGLTGAQVPPLSSQDFSSINPGSGTPQQSQLPPAVPARNYSQNTNGSPVTTPDYYASHRDQILAWGDEQAETAFPGNPTFRATIRQRLTNQMDAAIQSQTAQYKQDRTFIQSGIMGDLTKGEAPRTYSELYQIPGMADVLKRTEVHSPEYTKDIDTQIAKVSSQITTYNSPNGYDTIQRVLGTPQGSKSPNGIGSEESLDRLMGRSDSTGINLKDYNDAKKSLTASDPWKKELSQNMQSIAEANGNQDGQGQQRAIGFYNLAMKIHEQALKNGGTENDLLDKTSKNYIGKAASPYMPARDTQVANAAQAMRTAAPAAAAPRQPGESPDDYLKRTGL